MSEILSNFGYRSFVGQISRVRAHALAAAARLGSDDGQTLVEYVLIFALIVVIVGAVLSLLVAPLDTMYSNVGDAF